MAVYFTGTGEPYAGGNFSVVDREFHFGVAGTLSDATNVTPEWPISNYQGTLHRCDICVQTPPTGQNIIIDILYSTNGTSWTSLWASNPGNRPSIAAGAYIGGTTLFDTQAYVQQTLFRLDIIQVGSGTAGAGLGVHLV